MADSLKTYSQGLKIGPRLWEFPGISEPFDFPLPGFMYKILSISRMVAS